MCLGFVKRWFEGTELVDETAEGPYIRLGVVGLLLHEFRRHVVGCADISLSETGLGESLGQSKISKLNSVVLVQKYCRLSEGTVF